MCRCACVCVAGARMGWKVQRSVAADVFVAVDAVHPDSRHCSASLMQKQHERTAHAPILHTRRQVVAVVGFCFWWAGGDVEGVVRAGGLVGSDAVE